MDMALLVAVMFVVAVYLYLSILDLKARISFYEKIEKAYQSRIKAEDALDKLRNELK